MPVPAPTDATPATDKPVAPAVASGRAAAAPATAVTADTVDISGKKTYTVAPGRTLAHGHPAPKDLPAGTIGKVDYLKGGTRQDPKSGDTVELEEGDAKRLIDLGFLLAPDGSVVIPVDGPATDVENGVSITQDLKDGPLVSQA